MDGAGALHSAQNWCMNPTPAPGAAMLRIDFVSDVVCPWCAVGLASLEIAIARVAPAITVDLNFQPFELNPQMPPEGEDATEHLQRKYGIDPERVRANRVALEQRAAAVGLKLDMARRTRIWNTFDAHRLLHWAGTLGSSRQLALKKALFEAYFVDALNLADRAVLAQRAADAGLDRAQALEVLEGDAHAAEVRDDEAAFTQAGIHAVPAVIINRQHLISGGQPPEIFERALRQVAGAQPPEVMTA